MALISWLPFIGQLNLFTPHEIVDIVAKCHGIPPMNSRETIINTINTGSKNLVQIPPTNPNEMNLMARFLNPNLSTQEWRSENLMEAYKNIEILSKNTFDPSIPYGFQTPSQTKIYNPLLIYMFSRQCGIRFTPATNIRNLYEALCISSKSYVYKNNGLCMTLNPRRYRIDTDIGRIHMRENFDPNRNENTYTLEQLENYIEENGLSGFIDQYDPYLLLKELYLRPTFIYGYRGNDGDTLLGTKYSEHKHIYCYGFRSDLEENTENNKMVSY